MRTACQKSFSHVWVPSVFSQPETPVMLLDTTTDRPDLSSGVRVAIGHVGRVTAPGTYQTTTIRLSLRCFRYRHEQSMGTKGLVQPRPVKMSSKLAGQAQRVKPEISAN